MIKIKRVLVSTDFSEAAAKALPYAASLAQEYKAELHVVHVVEDSLYYAQFVYDGAPFDPTVLIEGLVADRKKRLEEVLKGLPSGLKVTTHLRRGVVASEIIASAGELDADVVVIATHGRTGLSHLIFGSVAERVVRECPCPVLTVREKAHGMIANGNAGKK
ncbi:MAG: universal stress protein [Planctomycetota bacterium]|nr:universal stress protein [Planctomycetota bacterium]